MDITFTNIPDKIGEEQAREWMAILIERFYNAQINSIPEVIAATETAKSGIDTFRESNSLTPKFRKTDVLPIKEEPISE